MTAMLTPEELRVLSYLAKHLTAAINDLARACLPGASAEWLERVVSNLDWLGYLILYHGPGGQPAAVQITEQGRQQVTQGRLPQRWSGV
jgi:hypothetical protein